MTNPTKTLSAIHIYPVKGCKGFNLERVFVGPKGPSLDRRFLIIDSTGRFITQRQFPKIALIETALENEDVILRLPNGTEHRLSLSSSGPEREVSVWKDTCTAIDLGDEPAQSISRYLEKECRLVFMPDKTLRQVNQKYAEPSDVVGFADGYPFLLISEASLEELNSRLEKPVPMNRFRPNLVISGCKPFEEDTWKRIRIGKITFKAPKHCSRCTVITIDQSSAEVGEEPLKTLLTYRKQEKGVMFGQNLIHTAKGDLFVGDTLEVIE